MEAFHCFLPIRKPPNLLSAPATSLFRPPKSRASKIARILIPNLADERAKLNSVDAKASVSAASSSEGKPVQSEPHIRFRPREGEGTERTRIEEELREAAEKSLEWRSVCSQMAAFSRTAAGREFCRSGRLRIGGDRVESQKLLDQTAAAVLLPEKLDFSDFDDVTELVRSAVHGELLTVREICAVGRSLTSARRIMGQLLRVSSVGTSSDGYFPLVDILQNCDFLTELVNKMSFCIDCNLFVILDRASTSLATIRSERKQNIDKLEELLKMESIKVFQAGAIDSPLVTKRRNRMCVGVKASHKSLLPNGVVLSVSSSGATYFMEPEAAVRLNNAEVEFLNSEKAEEIAIMRIFTSEIAESEAKIRHLMDKIPELDLACARGAYALWMDGVCPALVEDNNTEKSNDDILSVDIEGIYHPLLLEPFLICSSSTLSSSVGSQKMENGVSETRTKSPVPIDIKIRLSKKVVVISGPNTGGKTATLKTLGLASLMSKAGMFLPAKKKPRIPWFDQILTDIGDHQSLEHNLSTFSGHISRICKIIQVTTKESLVLIDEIGSGTDPSEGVALSSSILQHLADYVNLLVVTTHYADLSLLKASDSRFENAAMEFCMATLQPTYNILWGCTGNSNALSIAKSIGFDQKVLDRAREWAMKLAPHKQTEWQGSLYQYLVDERSVLEYQAKEAASLLLDVKKLYFEIQAEAQDLRTREMALKANETRNLQEELKFARSQMEAVIKNFEDLLQSANPDQFNSILRKSESKIASIAAAYQRTINNTSEEEKSNSTYTPKIGERVSIKGFGDKVATVIEAPTEDGTAVVQCGKIKVRVKKNDMRPVETSIKNRTTSSGFPLIEQEQKQHFRQEYLKDEQKDSEVSFGPAVRTSKNTVDLHGMRIDDASHTLQIAIGGCKSNSVLFIIHGMGTGAVKDRAHRILRDHPRVVKFEEESPMNHGCTLAYIR
ncbi:uncharacterized protein LOC110018562 [Phalaenopsis equestris]|uniref:uncharacterized protein LOC110018562 n=1 Tax=Phalaenopsis equestris TaxID=78828 RepID=UPI0009E3B51C|nr:uncharacterized protein LOC110018562 [Phalaenopsis equestris]